MFDPSQLRRAQAEEDRELLFAEPKVAWAAPADPREGAAFEIHSSFEIEGLSRAFPGQFRAIRDVAPPRLERCVRVHSAAGFTRTDAMPAGKDADNAPFALESPALGAVYIDAADRSYIHFSPEQLPQVGLPTSLKKVAPKWEVIAEADTLTLSVRGVASLDVVIQFSDRDESSPEIAAIVLAASLPGLDQLSELGLPLEKIQDAGTPRTVEIWLVNGKGRRVARLARHRISGVTSGLLDPALFRIPEGFRDLRDGGLEGDRAWRPLGGPRLRTRRGKPARGQKATAEQMSRAIAATGASGDKLSVWQAVTHPAGFSTEPAIPECLPSTLHTTSALEIRQTLLDAIQLLVNLLANRLSGAVGTRADPTDPENTDVQLTIDWLEQLRQFHESRGNWGRDYGDGLYCLLRDAPSAEDPVGGTGLLDRMAEALARHFVAENSPIPLGGPDDPIELPPEVEAEIIALAQDPLIPADERYNELSDTSRVVVREEVLAQRIATFTTLFNGDFGQHLWPRPDYDLVRIRLQLERLAVEFSYDDTVRQLLIALADSDPLRPRIEFELACERLEAMLTMERQPGTWFWWTAAGVLVALAIVGSAAVAGLIVTLMGMGPLGWLVLMMLLSQAPAAALAGVAGGVLLLAAVTYLVWDVSRLRLTLEQPVLRSSLTPGRSSDPQEVVLAPDGVALEGDIAVSVNSTIPSGMHQLFDAVVNIAVTQFDAQIRETIELNTTAYLQGMIRILPHFRLPQPFAEEVSVEYTGPLPFDHLSANVPDHDLYEIRTQGSTERLLSAGALGIMNFPFPWFAPQATQVDRDLRDMLTEHMEQVAKTGWTPRLGYAISQNLLNGNIFAQWLAGRFALEYNASQVGDALAVLVAACPDCAGIGDAAVRVWAAASPQLFVTPRAYLEAEDKRYLSVLFPDVRVCICGVAGKPAALEIQFSMESVAHVAFGALNLENRRSLFTLERNYLHVLYDDRPEYLRLSPVGAQGLEVSGDGSSAIAALDDAERLKLLQDLQPVLESAAVRLLRRDSVSQISFVPDSPRVDQHVYDEMALAEIRPRRASLSVVFTSYGTIGLVIPTRDATDQWIPPSLSMDNWGCKDGAAARGGTA
jgi:hypothetical protein